MATPPWLESGPNLGPPPSIYNSLGPPPQQQQPSQTGLSALERMLDSTPCGPKPDQQQNGQQFCQTWPEQSQQQQQQPTPPAPPPPSSQQQQQQVPMAIPPPYHSGSPWYPQQAPGGHQPEYVPFQGQTNLSYSQQQQQQQQALAQPTNQYGTPTDGQGGPGRPQQPPQMVPQGGQPTYYNPQQNTSTDPHWWYPQSNKDVPSSNGVPVIRPFEQFPQGYYGTSDQNYQPQPQQPFYNQSIPSSSNFGSSASSQTPQTSYPQPPQFDQQQFVSQPYQPSSGQQQQQQPTSSQHASGTYFDNSYCDRNIYGPVKNEPSASAFSSPSQMIYNQSQQSPSQQQRQAYLDNNGSSALNPQQQQRYSLEQMQQMSSQQMIAQQPLAQQSQQSALSPDGKKTRRRNRKGKEPTLPQSQPPPSQPPPQMMLGHHESLMNPSLIGPATYQHHPSMGPPFPVDSYQMSYGSQYPQNDRMALNQQQGPIPGQYQGYLLSDQSPMTGMGDPMIGNPMQNSMMDVSNPYLPMLSNGNRMDTDHSLQKDHGNGLEKDESTQESTNTLESGRTENEDDDASKMGATNGDKKNEVGKSDADQKTSEDDEDKKSKFSLRKNIKDIKDEASLDERTKIAQKEEQERIKRLQEQRMKALNSIKELRSKLPTPFHHETKPPVIPMDSDEDKEDKKDVIDISSGDEDDVKDRDVINVSDESEEEEEIDVMTNVHPIRDEQGRVLINVGHPDDEEDIFLAPQLAHVIKPHQIGGVRFLYENVIESTNRFNTTSGFGCILAHSMGLGKTIQVITFSDVFLRHTTGRKILIITPINTIQNWQAEFEKWIPREDQVHPSHVSEGHVRPRNFEVFLLNEAFKTAIARHRIIKRWDSGGGVLLMGYEMYRMLALKKAYKPKGRKKANTIQDTEESMRKDRELLEEVYEALVNPGPDLVVCDEGHRIKNCNATTSAALKDIKTRRRVVLTGYPLQNNLIEYWCMVDFVRPSYLGTKMEFTNMFERPIQNGQCVDSTPKDRQLMKFRAHVLHSLLNGFVQRRGHGVLKDALPHKEEHVIFIRMTPIQRALYSTLVKEFVTTSESANPLKIFAVCCKIWNHPDILYNLVRDKQGLPPTAVMDLDIDDGAVEASESVTTNGTSRKGEDPDGNDPEPEEDGAIGAKRKRGRKKKESPPGGEQSNKINDDDDNKISYEWAYELMEDYKADDVTNSYKMVLLMEVIDTALRIGDKLLVFSQSLLTLDLVERFLQMRDLPPRPGLNYTDKWVKNRTYFRLDGGTSGQEREKLINDFNHNPCVALFLLSTRAGCLGINLIGANRIVVLDASWNPCHDAQAVCRVYRYGQQKPCYIYRFVCDNSLEKRIYDRQVNKQGMSDRVVDEMNPEAKLTWKDVSTLIQLDETDPPEENFSTKSESFKDPVMKQIVSVASSAFTKLPFEHESLLLDQKDQKLTKYEKRLAKMSYEQEKRAAQLGGRGYNSGGSGGIINLNARSNYGGGGGGYPSRYGMVRDVKTGQLVPNPMGMGINAGTALIHGLIKQGMTVQKMRIPRSLSIGLVNEPPVHLPAGCELFVMKTPRGVYLRLPCERVLAMKLPQTLDQLCMARPSPFRASALLTKKEPEVINLDDDDDDSSTDIDDERTNKPKVITIESETISRNKGLYDMLIKDSKSTKKEEEDILGRMAANKNLQLQVVNEVRTERKARMKITQRKNFDKDTGGERGGGENEEGGFGGEGGKRDGGDGGRGGGGEDTAELNGESGAEADSDAFNDRGRHHHHHHRRHLKMTEDDEVFDLASLSGEITVSPVRVVKKKQLTSLHCPTRKVVAVDLDAEEGVPSSTDNSQGSGSDNSTEIKRNPLAIQNLEDMLSGTKSAPPPAAVVQQE